MPAMRLIVVAVLLSFASTAMAQRGRRRTPKPPPTKPAPAPPTASKKAPATSTQAQPKNDKKTCESRQALLENDQRLLDERQATMSGLNAEIQELEQRLTALHQRRVQLARRLGRSEMRNKNNRKAYKAACEANEDCAQYERMVDRLDQRSKPVQVALAGIKKEIADNHKQVKGLRGRIEPLRNEYRAKRCNNLVPGETSQSTIDRCSQIFSDWNRLQAQLNRANNSLPEVKRRYGELLTQMDNTERRARGYEEYLARNCSRSPKLKIARKFKGTHDRAKGVQNELTGLVNEVNALRKIRIGQ